MQNCPGSFLGSRLAKGVFGAVVGVRPLNFLHGELLAQSEWLILH